MAIFIDVYNITFALGARPDLVRNTMAVTLAWLHTQTKYGCMTLWAIDACSKTNKFKTNELGLIALSLRGKLVVFTVETE